MIDRLDTQAISILNKNDRGGYTVPTDKLYPHQWNWDSAFVALGFGTFNRERAWQELELLLDGQWQNGMVPSILFRHNDPDYFPGPSVWQTQSAYNPPPPMPSTGISQPPVLASIMHQLVATGNGTDLQRAADLFEKVHNWHNWYQRERSTDGVVGTSHPWETGRDNCPDWELGLQSMAVDSELGPYQRMDTRHANPEQRPSKEQYDKYLTIVKFGREHEWNQTILTREGPFLMADPGIHFILMRANRDLLKLAGRLGLKSEIEELESAIQVQILGTDYFWNDELEAFTARNVKTGEFSMGFSSASALCFLADAGTTYQQQKTLQHIERIAGSVEYLLPSWDPQAAHFDAQRYWCGPVWPQMNYLVSNGLIEQGHDVIGNAIRTHMATLIAENGFYECFNPLTGAGCLGADFSWTAAIWLAWASPNRQELAA